MGVLAHLRPTIVLARLLQLTRSFNSRFQRLHCLRLLYIAIVSSGLATIFTLNSLLITKGAESTDILTAFLDHHIKEINHSCIALITRNSDSMWRIRLRLQQFSNYRTHEIDKILNEEFKSCIRESGKHTRMNPCLMKRKLLRKMRKLDFKTTPPSIKQIDEKYQDVLEDGFYSGPPGCAKPQHSTLFILPYRNRERHLR